MYLLTLSHPAPSSRRSPGKRVSTTPEHSHIWTEVDRSAGAARGKVKAGATREKVTGTPNDPEPAVQSQVSQKEKDKYRSSTHGICKDGSGEPDFRAAVEVLLHSSHTLARSDPKSSKSGFSSTGTVTSRCPSWI